MEHHANIVPWQLLCDKKQLKLKVIPVTDEGDLDLNQFEEYYGKGVGAVRSEMRESLRDQLTAERMQSQILSGTSITPSEVKTYFEKIQAVLRKHDILYGNPELDTYEPASVLLPTAPRYNLNSLTQQMGIGAQFGGKYFCHDVRIVRLPRHGASCPIGIGVSCSADRNIKAKITAEGLFLEQLETDPAKYLPEPGLTMSDAVAVDLNRSMDEIRATLTQYPVATPLLLTGKIVVARDIAHAKLKERLDRGEDLLDYIKNHIVYYAGPAKTPPGYASGSFGPTTAARMDPYVPIFQARGGSMVMLAKGNRSKQVLDACQQYGGFYLGSIGGPAARLGKECITQVEVVEYEELGMEAIFMITVKDFPAFILIDDKGNDFFAGLL